LVDIQNQTDHNLEKQNQCKNELIAVIKKSKRGEKPKAALLLFKKMKRLQGQQTFLENNYEKLDVMKMNLENITITASTMGLIKNLGENMLKIANEQLGEDGVDDLVSNNEDVRDRMRDITEALNTMANANTPENDAELEDQIWAELGDWVERETKSIKEPETKTTQKPIAEKKPRVEILLEDAERTEEQEEVEEPLVKTKKRIVVGEM